MERPFVHKKIIKHVGYLSFVIVFIASLFDRFLYVAIPIILLTSLFKLREETRWVWIGYTPLSHKIGLYILVPYLLVEAIKYLLTFI